MTVKEEIIDKIGKNALEEKVEEKKKEFYNLINNELAIKLIAREEGIDSKTILVLELISAKQGKEYDCIDDKGYFTLVVTEQNDKLDNGKIYQLNAFKQEENKVRRTYSTKIIPREIKTSEITLAGNKVLIGKPEEVRIKEYKKCYKCTNRNCDHEKQTKKMTTLILNKNKVIIFDSENQKLNQEICVIGTEKINKLSGDKEIIAKKVICA